MSVTILYFAWIREKVGTGQERVSLPDDVKTVSDCIEWLKDKDAAHADAFADMTLIRAAVDQVHVPLEAEIAAATEIAFFPPVTGGQR